MRLNVIDYRSIYLGIAGALAVISLALFAFMGLNLGIDFRGGTLLERSFEGDVTVADIEAVLADESLASLGMGTSFIQPLQSPDEDESIFLIRTAAVITDAATLQAIEDALAQAFGEVTLRRTESVGPVIGQELQRNAIWALLFTGIGILAYISFRFEYRFGIIAVAALLFDVLVVIGVISLLQVEINTSFIAAILTVVGYSINDTIVIFDRIRERLGRTKSQPLGDLVNDSVNQTLARSINTNVTTISVVAMLHILGGAPIRDFTLVLLVGIIIASFTSIFVASPLWYVWRQTELDRQAA